MATRTMNGCYNVIDAYKWLTEPTPVGIAASLHLHVSDDRSEDATSMTHSL